MKSALRKIYTWIPLSIMAGVIMIFAAQQQVNAQASEGECNGLDIVFLVDQSGSMAKNDADVLRMSAVKTAIDIIGDNATYFCPEAQHRFAVLGFGDQDGGDANDVVPYIAPVLGSQPGSVPEPGLVDPDLANLNEWLEVREELKDRLPVDNKVETLLGNTNHAAALNYALRVFGHWAENAIEGLPRKQAVVFLTDGGPCVIEDGSIVTGCTAFASAMDSLENLTNPTGNNYPWRGEDNPASIFIWVIALQGEIDPENPEDDVCYLCDPNLLASWNNITRGHGGGEEIFQLQYGEGVILNADITSVVATVMDRMLGSLLELKDCTEEIWIDPYVSNVSVIHLFRRGANPGYDLDDVVVRVRIVHNGVTIVEFNRGVVIQGQGNIDDYSQDGPNERYVLYRPPAGKLIVETDNADICEDLDVRIGQTGIEVTPLSPAQAGIYTQVDQDPYYDPDEPVPFNVQLLQQVSDGGLQPLQENPGFEVTMSVTIRSLEDVAVRVEDTYTLERMDDQAHYASVDPDTHTPTYIKLQYPGHYTWELTAVAPNPRVPADTQYSDETPIVIATAQGAFQVAPLVREFDFVVHAPQHIRLVDGISGNPVKVTLEVVDRAGNPLRSDLMIASSAGSQPFEAYLYDADGNQIDRQYMALVEGSKSAYTVDLFGSGSNPLQFEEGAYSVVVKLTEDYNSALYIPLRRASEAQPVNMALAQHFAWSVSEPVPNMVTSIHPAFGWFPEPLKVAMALRTTTTSTPEENISADKIAADDGEAAFLGEILVEGRTEPIIVYFYPDEETERFVADWPVDLATQGKYTLTVSTRLDHISPDWVPDKDTAEPVVFYREDGLINQPWALAGFISAVVGLVLLVLMIAIGISRPIGVVSFIDSRKRALLHEEILGKRWWFQYKSKNAGLKEIGLSKVIVKKVPADKEKAPRAVLVQAFDKQGVLLGEYELHSGETDDLDDGVDVKYE